MMPGKIGSGVGIAWASYACAAAYITLDALDARAPTMDRTPRPDPARGLLTLGGVDNAHGRQHDVAPDRRFLINQVFDNSAPAPITSLTNWNPEAKK